MIDVDADGMRVAIAVLRLDEDRDAVVVDVFAHDRHPEDLSLEDRVRPVRRPDAGLPESLRVLEGDRPEMSLGHLADGDERGQSALRDQRLADLDVGVLRPNEEVAARPERSEQQGRPQLGIKRILQRRRLADEGRGGTSQGVRRAVAPGAVALRRSAILAGWPLPRRLVRDAMQRRYGTSRRNRSHRARSTRNER